MQRPCTSTAMRPVADGSRAARPWRSSGSARPALRSAILMASGLAVACRWSPQTPLSMASAASRRADGSAGGSAAGRAPSKASAPRPHQRAVPRTERYTRPVRPPVRSVAWRGPRPTRDSTLPCTASTRSVMPSVASVPRRSQPRRSSRCGTRGALRADDLAGGDIAVSMGPGPSAGKRSNRARSLLWRLAGVSWSTIEPVLIQTDRPGRSAAHDALRRGPDAVPQTSKETLT